MERQDDSLEQAVAVELLPSRDRASVILLFRSDAPIGLPLLISAVENFSAQLKAQLEKNKSKIEVQTPKIISP